jgi:DNA transposition AAA+ family ATPase
MQNQLSYDQKNSLRVTLDLYLRAKGISQAKFASISQVSTATISNILNYKWEQISDEIWLKVESKCQSDIVEDTENPRQTQSPKWGIIKGKGFTTIHSLCKDAQENSRMLAIYGETGYGKTCSLQEYKKENPKSTYYVLADELMNQKQFLQAIAEELGVEKEGDKGTILRAVVQALNSKPQTLLMLDDVGKLNDNCLRLIRLIYDRTVDRVGIVLAGTTYFKNYIDMRVRKDTMGFRELHRRIEYWQQIDKPEDKLVEVICQRNGIDTVECVNYIKTYHATNFGKLKSTITNLHRIAKGNKVSLDLLQRVR